MTTGDQEMREGSPLRKARLPGNSAAAGEASTIIGSAGSTPHGLSPEAADYLDSRYEVMEQIGSGGFGTVYRGRHRQLAMDIAIKILKAGASSDRFLREARLLAQIKSPHVVRVHDFELIAGDTPVIVMEWVDGIDLRQMLRDFGGRIGEQYVLPWMAQVCRGMMAAAAEGIIHRDLKPSNILIDRRNQARVADFGLARSPDNSDEASLMNDVLGTPLYMAPEQAEDPHAVDSRADIYSFGATFYHALTGEPPFTGKNAFTVLFKHKTEPLIAPKARFGPLGERTCEILERCLAKSPSDRFQSFAALLRQLEASASSLSPWNDTDDEDLADYLRRYQARSTAYFQEPRPAGLDDVYEFPHGQKLRILTGDLVEQNVEALVSSDDEELSMGGGVSGAILAAAGREVGYAARAFAPVRPGRAVVTTAGALSARFIFHAVTIGCRRIQLPSPDVLAELLTSCFYHADTLSVTSMAIPLLGTGNGGFPQDICLATLVRCIARTFLRSMTTVREVRIVLRPRMSEGAARDSATDHLTHHSSLTEGRMAASALRELLPRVLPKINGYEVFAVCDHSLNIRGDFYDAFPLRDGKVCLAIGDASGTALTPLVNAARVAALLREGISAGEPLVEVVTRINQELTTASSHSFVTFLAMLLDPATHTLSIVNAGHLAPVLRGADGTVSHKSSDDDVGLPLGVKNYAYKRYEINLEVGETLVLLNEGVSEGMNAQCELYGMERLRKFISCSPAPAAALGRVLCEDAKQFSRDRPGRECITLLVLSRDGSA